MSNVPELGTARSYTAGTQLFAQGEAAADVFRIQSGAIKLVWTDAEGREAIVGLRWPGSLLGAAAVIAGLPNPAAAVTLIASSLQRVSGERFLQMLQSSGPLAMLVHEAQSRELLGQTLELGEIATLSAKMRFLNLLERLACSVSIPACLPDGRLQLPLKKKELAALLAVTPEYLSRMLSELTSEGAIGMTGQWIVVRNSAFAPLPSSGRRPGA